jgi:Tfp pilus assembly protein PilN
MRAVNLIPDEQRGGSAIGAGRSGGGAYAVLGLLAGFAVLALLYGMAAHKVTTNRAKAASLETKVQQIQASAAKLAPYTSFDALREQRLHAVSELVGARFDWAHAFHELGRVLPFTVSLNSLTGTVGSTGTGGAASSGSAGASGGAVTSSTPPGSVPTFTLTGCALTQTAVADTLGRLRLIDGVGSVTLQSSTKTVNSGGSGASGGCNNGDPAFTVQVTFAGLPTAAATSSSSSSTTPASAKSGGA